MNITKSAIITITGRPNVGKSTLANAIVGEKVAIVSNKPQTTRNRIYAIRNLDDTQLVFVDTPGFHKPKNQLGEYMVNVVRESVMGVDACLLIVEPIANIGEQEQALLQYIKQAAEPSVLVINKIDTVKKDELLAVIATYSAAHTFDHIVPISAKTGEGVDKLLEMIGERLDSGSPRCVLHIPYDKGGLLDQLYREAKVENVEYGETIAVTAVCTPKVLGQMAPFLVE